MDETKSHLLSDQKIQELKSTHGPIGVVENNAETIALYFRKPSRMEFARWVDTKAGRASAAAVELASSCLLHPDLNSMLAAFESQPALLTQDGGVSDVLLELSGVTDRGPKKKIL